MTTKVNEKNTKVNQTEVKEKKRGIFLSLKKMKLRVKKVKGMFNEINESFYPDKEEQKREGTKIIRPKNDFPKKSEFKKIEEMIISLYENYENLYKYKPKIKTKAKNFTIPRHYKKVIIDFISRNKPWDEKIPSVQTTYGHGILSKAIMNAFMGWYIRKNELKQKEDSKLSYYLYPNEELKTLLETQCPNLFSDDKPYKYFNKDVEITINKKKNDKGDIGILHKDFQKICEKFFESNYPVVMVKREINGEEIETVKEEIEKELEFMKNELKKITEEEKVEKNKEDGKEIVKKKKKEKEIKIPLTELEFNTKITTIIENINNIKERCYPINPLTKKIYTKKDYSNAQVKGKKDFIKVTSVLRKFTHEYKKLYKKRIFTKGSNKNNGFLRTTKIPKELFNLLHLNEVGLPHRIVSPSLVTIYINRYINQNNLRYEIEENKKIIRKFFKLDEPLRKIFNPYFEGVSKKGKKYEINPDKMTITDIPKIMGNIYSIPSEGDVPSNIDEIKKEATLKGKRIKPQEKICKELEKDIIEREKNLKKAKEDNKNIKEKDKVKGKENLVDIYQSDLTELKKHLEEEKKKLNQYLKDIGY